jgi:transcriptional regulator with XRE-family HTH domain
MALMRALAHQLRARRAARGWSQADLAARSGVSRIHIARIETGIREPTVGVLEKLAKALNVKPGALLG